MTTTRVMLTCILYALSFGGLALLRGRCLLPRPPLALSSVGLTSAGVDDACGLEGVVGVGGDRTCLLDE